MKLLQIQNAALRHDQIQGIEFSGERKDENEWGDENWLVEVFLIQDGHLDFWFATELQAGQAFSQFVADWRESLNQ